MPSRKQSSCSQRAQTEALVHDSLEGESKRRAQLHLETCESCRTFFRRETVGWLPRIRNYTLLERIGRGGFGEVFKAIHHTKCRTEALKILNPDATPREAYFQSEVTLVARLRHPNIATLFEAQLTGNTIYYTMELVDGTHLGQYVETSDTPIEQRIEIIKKITSAIGYAHTQEVVHRDLKPQNVLIDADGEPHIVDFGIARWCGRDETAMLWSEDPFVEGAIGTRGYISPEQRYGGDIDGRADIFAIGVMLYTLVTGEPATEAKRRSRIPKLLQKLHIERADELAAIILRATADFPEQRYSDCDALARDLDNYLQIRATAAYEHPSIAHRASRIANYVLRHGPLAIQAVIAMAVAFSLSVIMYNAGTRGFSRGTGVADTAIIAITPETLGNIWSGELGQDLEGLVAHEPKSWRILYGHLMRTLADAEPSVVAWDYYFPDRQPEYDPAFVAGIEALGVPVVVACHELDINAEPKMSPEIREAIHDFGTIASPEVIDFNEIEVTYALKRGFNRYIPSLPIAAFAAAQAPEAHVNLHFDNNLLELRYRIDSAEPGQSRWLPSTQKLKVQNTVPITGEADSPNITGLEPALLRQGDQVLIGRCTGEAARMSKDNIFELGQVLAATPAERYEWFNRRPIVVGQMIPPMDLVHSDGTEMFGCEIIAMQLNSLLSGEAFERFARVDLGARICLYCVLVAVFVGKLRIGKGLTPKTMTTIAVVVFSAGTGLAMYTAHVITTPVLTELCIAISATLSVAGPVWLVAVARERQMRMTPFAPIDDTTTTMANTLELRSSQLESN